MQMLFLQTTEKLFLQIQRGFFFFHVGGLYILCRDKDIWRGEHFYLG